jgi:hypothetical protein
MLVTVATAALFAVAQSAAPTAIPDTAAGNRPWERGDRYLYQRFFAHVNSINQRADDAERQGMNSYYLRNYIQKTALLYPSQVAVLNQVAAELANNLAQYNATAAEARKDWHILVQRKRLSHEPVTPVPAQIRALQAGRDTLVLQARDRLRLGLGEAEFARLDSYLRTNPPWKRPGVDGSQEQIHPEVSEAPVRDRDHYKGFFRLVRYLKTKAEQERKLGLSELADGVQTIIQRQAGLSNEQTRILEKAASDYFQKLESYKPQIEAARRFYMKVRLDMLASEGKVTPTPELAAAQKSLSAVLNRIDTFADEAVQQLRKELGEEDFVRLDSFVRQRTKPSATGLASSAEAPLQGVAQ